MYLVQLPNDFGIFMTSVLREWLGWLELVQSKWIKVFEIVSANCDARTLKLCRYNRSMIAGFGYVIYTYIYIYTIATRVKTCYSYHKCSWLIIHVEKDDATWFSPKVIALPACFTNVFFGFPQGAGFRTVGVQRRSSPSPECVFAL